MKDTSFLTVTRFVHRGLHDNKCVPENSIEAFRLAIEHGYGIEFDVYLTDDNALIIHHDLSLKRTTGKDITAYKVDSSHLDNYHLYGTEHCIPLLSDLLELVNGKVPLILEIKTTNKINDTCNAIYDMIHNYHGDIAVESFDPRIVDWWLKHHSEYVIGQLYGNNRVVNMYLRLKRQYKKVDFLALSCEQLAKNYFQNIKLKNSNKIIVNWTVKSPKHLENALRYADNFIFEYNAKCEDYISLDDIALHNLT